MTVLRSRWFAFLGCALLVALAILLVDRPLAMVVEAHLRGTVPYEIATDTYKAFDPLGLAGGAFLVLGGGWALSGRPIPPWLRTALLCCLAAAIGFAGAAVLKYLTGRSGADVYATTGVEEWRWFTGTRGHRAFPSATMQVAAAALGVLWVREPPARTAIIAVTALLTTLLLIGNAHWLSDIIAGTFLGWYIGRRLACAFESSPPS